MVTSVKVRRRLVRFLVDKIQSMSNIELSQGEDGNINLKC
jgi:hypothetical protein